MEILSTDDLLHVLQYLPENDTARFNRLDKRLAAILAAHQTKLSKPKISLTILSQKTTNMRQLGELIILTPKGSISVQVQMSGNLSLQKKDITIDFMQPFFDHVSSSSKDIPYLKDQKFLYEVFIEWLNAKVEIDKLKIREISMFTTTIMNRLSCKCDTIVLNAELDEVLTENDKIFYYEFSQRQKKKNVNLKLLFEDDDHFEFYLDSISSMTAFSSIFADVSVKFSTVMFFDTILGITKFFVLPNSDVNNIVIRFDYGNERSLPAFKYDFISEVIAINIAIASKEDSFNDFVKCPSLEHIPEQWVVQHESNGYLTFNFLKKGTSVILKTETCNNKKCLNH